MAIFTRQLATLLKAGIPLAEALAALAEQADNRKLQLILAGVRQRVNEGGALADALGQHPRVFPELYINMVRSGEAAGNLDSVLERLAEFLDEQIALASKVSSALTYPVVMAVLGSVVMGILMVVVVPQIATVFEDSGKALPWNTQLLILAAGLAGNYWWVLIPLLVAGVLRLPSLGTHRPRAGHRRSPGAEGLGAGAVAAICGGGPVLPHPGHHAGLGRASVDRPGDREEGAEQHRAGDGWWSRPATPSARVSRSPPP